MKSYLDPKCRDEKWRGFKEKLDYLKNSIDPHYLLSSLGITIDHETPKEVRSSCPIHGGDNKTAFRFNKETRTWVCFTRKCHSLFGNDVIGLIKAVTGKEFIDAVDHLKQLAGDINENSYIELKRKREMDNFIQIHDKIILKHRSVNQNSLNRFKELRSAFFPRQGFKKTTLDYFEVAGGWQDTYGLIRDVIPIRNDEGELVAYSLRDTRNEDEVVDYDSKYILTPGFDKQNCLYNLNNAKDYCSSLPLIIVEGFKSVWRLHEYGIKNVVATIGAGITTGQQLLLLKYAEKGIVPMFDNDIAGVDATVRACEDLSSKMEVTPVFIQEVNAAGKGLDPADLTKEQVYEYLETYFKLEEN